MLAGIAKINKILYFSVSLYSRMKPTPLYINIQIQKKLIIARARSENGAVPVMDASHGAKNSIKIERNMKIIPKINQILFQVFSENIFSYEDMKSTSIFIFEFVSMYCYPFMLVNFNISIFLSLN